MEKYKEIERSIIKTYRKDIWSRFIKAVIDYQLINEGDNIMVCISGGKDSFLLAKCIQELQRHGKYKFMSFSIRMNQWNYKPNKNGIVHLRTAQYHSLEVSSFVYMVMLHHLQMYHS